MSLVSIRNLTFTHGGPLLFDGVIFEINTGERIGLVGRNGSGKSTLLKLLHGELLPDDGEIIVEEHRRFGRLVQEIPAMSSVAVADVVRLGLHSDVPEPDANWKQQQKVDRAVSLLNLCADADFASLSSGMACSAGSGTGHGTRYSAAR